MYKLITYPECELKFDYYINEKGEVLSSHYNRKMSYMIDKDGYLRVRLTMKNRKRRNFPVHRLVLTMFKPISDMNVKQVNHIDGNKKNNNISNLEWCTSQENTIHAVKLGLRNDKGEHNYFHKLFENDIIKIKEMYSTGKFTQKELGRIYNVHEETVGKIIRGVLWKHVS